MSTQLNYAEHIVELDLPAERVIACCGAPQTAAVADVRAATAAALAAPLGFPPLAEAVVPGDRIVVALDHDVPCSRAIVAAIFDCLVGRGVNPADITLLVVARSSAEDGEALREYLPEAYRGTSTIEAHDPDARDRLCYLASDTHNDSIYLNRVLCDADVVIPVGCLRCEPAIDYHGMFGGLFPTFAGKAAQDKLFARGLTHAARQESRCRETIQEVGWLLGVQFTVQVVPGAAGDVLGVFAGDPGEVFGAGQAACQAAWAFRVPHTAELVVAAIDGGADEQTWDNLARALAAASRVVSAEGAIVVCTAIVAPPGPNVRRVCEANDIRSLQRTLVQRRSPDSLAAVALASAAATARVYLISGLPEASIEDTNLTLLAGPEELSRLAERFPSCIVIGCAQYAVPTLADD